MSTHKGHWKLSCKHGQREDMLLSNFMDKNCQPSQSYDVIMNYNTTFEVHVYTARQHNTN